MWKILFFCFISFFPKASNVFFLQKMAFYMIHYNFVLDADGFITWPSFLLSMQKYLNAKGFVVLAFVCVHYCIVINMFFKFFDYVICFENCKTSYLIFHLFSCPYILTLENTIESSNFSINDR